MIIIYIFIGFILGLFIGYLYVSKHSAILETNIANSEKQLAEIKSISDKLSNENEQLKENKTLAEAEVKSLREQLSLQLKDVDENHKRLKEEFQNLATQILKENSSDITKMSTESIKNIVDPLTERIKEFKDKVENCYGDEAKERRSLSDEVKRLVEQNQKIGEDANNLTNALKGESKTQGDWGEMILEDILQKSGLKEGEQYFPQDTLRDENGNLIKTESERSLRPDMIVVYPGDRKIIIDSKVSLTAYTEYVNAKDTITENNKLKEHLNSVKKHIDELNIKDYAKYSNEAPEFVMMFIPNESAYYTAIKADPNLWNYAYQKKVLLMNQTNLITALRLALDLWRRDAQEKNILEIVKIGSDLYDKFVGFTENLKEVGNAIDKAHKSYDEAMGQLSEGKGNLINRAEKLKGLGITPKKRLSISSKEENINE